MATWTSQSFALVNKGSYLDKLADIYPVATPRPRPLNKSQINAIQTALDKANDQQLLTLLLKSEKFPFNDPYVSFLRANPSQRATNPKTVHRISQRLRDMGLDNVIGGLQEPPQAIGEWEHCSTDGFIQSTRW